MDGSIGGGPPELAEVLALGQRAAGVVHEAARDPEVDDAPVVGRSRATAGEHKICRLDVPMNVPRAMYPIQCAKQTERCSTSTNERSSPHILCTDDIRVDNAMCELSLDDRSTLCMLLWVRFQASRHAYKLVHRATCCAILSCGRHSLGVPIFFTSSGRMRP